MNTFADSAAAAGSSSSRPIPLLLVHRRAFAGGQRYGLPAGLRLRPAAGGLAGGGPLSRGAALLLTLLNTLLALPSVVVGLVIYLLLSRSGPLGFLGWLFSFKAMVLAQTILVLPVVTALTRQTIEDADRGHGEQLRSLGAGRCRAACCWLGRALCAAHGGDRLPSAVRCRRSAP